MADFDIPADLVQHRRDFLAAQGDYSAACAEWPPGREIVTGVEVPDELRDRTDEAYRRMLAAVVAKHGHEWWATVPAGQRYEAEKALNAAAAAQAG